MKTLPLALSLLLSASALAQTPAPTGATDDDALRLFQEGSELMQQGREKEACAKFQLSFDIGSALGPLLNLAVCRAQIGETAEAATLFRRSLTMLEPADERRIKAQEKLTALEPTLGKLSVGVADPSQIPNVWIDTKKVDLNSPDPVFLQPGNHRVRIEYQGRPPHGVDVTIAAGENRSLIVEPAPLAPPAPVTTTPPAQAPFPSPPAAPEPAGNGPSILGWSLVGVGAASLVASGVFVAIMKGHDATVQDECIDGACSPEGIDANDSGKTAGAVATGTFIGGAVLAGAGVAYLLIAPDWFGAKVSTTGTSVTVAGSF